MSRRTVRGPRVPSGYQVGPGMWVQVRYQAWDEDGEPIVLGSDTLSYLHGLSSLLPRVEQGMEGASVGEIREFKLPPKDAFGKRDPRAQVEFAREEFPPEVKPGDHFEAESDSGELLVLRVLEVVEDAVIVDSNHPLAGQTIRFAVEVLDVRPATDSEVKQAEASLLGGQEAEPELIPVGRLLRGPTRRYEMGPQSEPTDPTGEET